MKDPLKEFVALREALTAERQQLLHRLQQIESVLNGALATPAAAARRGRPPGTAQPGATGGLAKTTGARSPNGKRIRNKVSLRSAIIEVTRNKPMTKSEILAAVQKNGYIFNAKDPVPSLNSVLYANKQFKNVDGKFSPA